MSDEAPAARRSGFQMTVLGMPVSIPLSGIAGVAIIAWLWSPTFGSGLSATTAAIVFAALLYAGILAHELAHGLSARKLGNTVHGITLWIFGGYTVYERDGLTPGREAIIAASGPLTTLGVAGLAHLGATWLSGVAPLTVVLVLEALAWTNLILAVINMLPGLPLDGGGVVAAGVWALTGSEQRGVKVAAWAGRLLALGAVLLPLVMAALPGSQLDLITVVVAITFGVFLWAGATAALRRAALEEKIPALAAATLARRAVPARPEESLAMAMQRMEEYNAGAIVVQNSIGQVIGVVNDTAAQAAPVERRPWIPVSSMTTPLPAEASLGVGLTGEDLVRELQRLQLPTVIVRDDEGAIYGVLVVDDVERALS